jgi:transcriptional regulator with XRE-family HTH domain
MKVMSESRPKPPFATLGDQLKHIREQARQTLAEVSGAVEIDQNTLERIENGQERPAEDVLALLINYFDMSDRQADRLWDLAGYTASNPTSTVPDQKSLVLLLALDTRTLYSDGLDINCNQAGMTLTFTQSGQPEAQPVARIGLSYEQAANVSEALQRALLHAQYMRGPRALPPTTDQP